MIAVGAVIGLLFAHLLGDYFLQTDWMALNKSKRWDALLLHAVVYSSCFLYVGSKFTAITLVLHFITDALTSRVTSKLWFVKFHSDPTQDRFVGTFETKKRHWFFVCIGVDQFIHFVSLLWVYHLLT